MAIFIAMIIDACGFTSIYSGEFIRPAPESSPVLLEVVAGIIIGVLLGTVSGLVPGIHANTMAGFLLGLQAVLLGVLDPVTLAVAMFAALVTHTFLDILPSTFLGVPDADCALSVLPAHALCLEGRGEEAVRISALGSAWAVIAAMPLFALFFLLLPSVQPYIDWGIGIILIAVAGLLIVYSDSPEWSCAIFLVSGLLGLFTFRYEYLAWQTAGGSSLLMPLLSGLFGLSVLLTASHGSMPVQNSAGVRVRGRDIVRQSVAGTVAGAVVGWLPGLSNATANALLSLGINYHSDREGYIAATSAANTANAFLALAALFALSRMRNGVMVALGSRELPPVHLLLLGGVGAAVAAYLLTVALAGQAHRFNGISVRHLSYAVSLLVVLLSFLLCGPFGIFVLVLATAVGLVPQLVNVRRVACMGAVMLPVICFSFGVM
jgi:putative membrane protein